MLGRPPLKIKGYTVARVMAATGLREAQATRRLHDFGKRNGTLTKLLAPARVTKPRVR